MKKLYFLLAFVLLLTSSNISIANDKVILQLKWKHQFQFAGYYAALEKGYYSEAGLDVKILEIQSGEESINKVIDGKADFGIAMSDLILHRANGQPVVALAAIFQHSPLIILTPKANGIENVHSLKGKRLGLETHSAELKVYLENEGISLEKIKLHPHDYDISNLISGKVDAISAYSTDEPFLLFNKGIKYYTFTPRSGGIDFYGDTLFTSEAQIKENPERVSAFLNASLKGWRYALENTDEIIDLILSKYTQRHSREHLLFEAQHSKNLIMADVVELGYMHSGRWEHIVETYKNLGKIDENFSFKGFMYVSQSDADFGWLKRRLSILIAICLLLSLGAMILVFFNRKLSKEVNKRKKTENLLIKSETLFHGLYDNMTSGSAIYEVINDGLKGSDYIVKSFNKKSLEIENKAFDQVVGKTLFDLRPNIDDYGLIPIMKKVWETGEPGYFPVKIYKDESFSSYYENFIFKIPTGEVVTIYNDVTDSKNSEMALKKSDKLYRLLTENATDVIWVLDAEHNIFRYVSPSVKQLLGYTPEEVIENGLAQLFTLSSLKYLESEVPKRLEKHKQGERQIFTDVFEQKHKDGRIVLVEVSAKYVLNSDTNRIEAVGVSRDITEKKQLEDRLQQAQKMESIGQLAGGIAHDFNNILYPIIGFTQLSKDDLPKDHPVQENLTDILNGAKRARDLVKRILLFSRQKDSKLKPTKLQPVIQESYKLMRSTIPSNINMMLDLYEGEDYVLCDSSEIHEIILNLCTNAYHAIIKDKGKIIISLKKENSVPDLNLDPGEYLCLSVKDNGVGIPETIMDKIFEPYTTTKDVGKGSGLGLSVVHGIVKNYHGGIHVESDPLRGTKFKMFLPCTTQVALNETIEEKKDDITGNNEHILLVDDEDSIIKLGVRALERSGYRVTGINDSLEAFKLFDSKPDDFDLVLTDMAMPNIVGSDLAKKILELRPDIPIIICSGYSERLDKIESKNLKVSAFLDKPLEIEKLVKKVREILDKYKRS